MSHIQVVFFEKGQENIIAEIHNDAFHFSIEKLGLQYGYKMATNQDVKDWTNIKDSFILIAYSNNIPVGYVHCGIEEIEGKERKIRNLVFIETKESLGQSKIAVLKEYQRKKIASKMLAKVIETAKDLNAETALALAYNKNISANRLLTKYAFKHEKFLYYEPYSKENQFIGDSVLAVFDLKQNLPSIKINKNITVRRIEKKDLVFLQEIFGECRSDVFGLNPSYAQIMDWYDSGWGEVTLVAELSEQVVGCMEFTSLGVIGIPGVLKKYRNQKIGSTLFYHLLLEMKNKNLEKALADTGFILQEAITMYKKFNFDLSRELWAWFKVL